ncbi:hypothetical protein GQ457_05G013500 [Hibiscus cannabinus]
MLCLRPLVQTRTRCQFYKRHVVNDGDSTYVALLPSGFAILPNVSPSYHSGQSNSNGQTANPDDNGTISSNGCILITYI